MVRRLRVLVVTSGARVGAFASQEGVTVAVALHGSGFAAGLGPELGLTVHAHKCQSGETLRCSCHSPHRVSNGKNQECFCSSRCTCITVAPHQGVPSLCILAFVGARHCSCASQDSEAPSGQLTSRLRLCSDSSKRRHSFRAQNPNQQN